MLVQFVDFVCQLIVGVTSILRVVQSVAGILHNALMALIEITTRGQMLLNIPKVLRMRWPTLLIQFAGKATQTFMRFIMQVASKPGMTPRARAACRHIRTDVLYSRSRVGPWVVEVLRGSANSVPAVIHVHELVTVRIIPGNGVFVPRRKRGLWRCH